MYGSNMFQRTRIYFCSCYLSEHLFFDKIFLWEEKEEGDIVGYIKGDSCYILNIENQVFNTTVIDKEGEQFLLQLADSDETVLRSEEEMYSSEEEALQHRKRIMDFTAEDLNCCKTGDFLEVEEYRLPTSYWYMIEHAYGASTNYKNRQRLQTRKGKVVKKWSDEMFKYLTLQFDEPPIESDK